MANNPVGVGSPWVRGDRRRTAAALALVLVCGVSLFVSAQGAITPTTPRRGGNPNSARVTNPIERSPASIAAGRRTYQRLCERCHGVYGKGDGGGAGAGGQPADLTDEAWEFGSTDGEIFSVIHDGTSADMESYADRIADTEIWNLVNFIRSIGR